MVASNPQSLAPGEITFPQPFATLAVVAILASGIYERRIGKFFLQFGLTISAAVMLSLLESLTITPMRCSSFVHHGRAIHCCLGQVVLNHR